MNKLTAEVALRNIHLLKEMQSAPNIGLSMRSELFLQALEIALPVLEQQEKGDDGWIEWGGGECPLSENTAIDFICRDGDEGFDYEAREIGWHHDGAGDDIIAYRVVQRGDEE